MNTTHAEATGTGSAAHPFFAGFMFDANQSLESLARFYGLNIPSFEEGITLAQFLTRRSRGIPRVGFRLMLGNAELVVIKIDEGLISKVGLRFGLPIMIRPHRGSSCGQEVWLLSALQGTRPHRPKNLSELSR